MVEQLIISGQAVDLNEKGSGITLVYGTQSDGAAAGAGSFTISLPPTPINRSIFGSPESLDVAQRPMRYRAYYYVQGYLFLRGWVTLLQVSEDEYQVQLTGGNQDWGTVFGSKKLKDVDTDCTNWKYRRWLFKHDGCDYKDSQGLTGAVSPLFNNDAGSEGANKANLEVRRYPIVNYGSALTAYYPACHANGLLRAHFAELGYTVKSDWLDANKDLALLFTNGEIKGKTQSVFLLEDVTSFAPTGGTFQLATTEDRVWTSAQDQAEYTGGGGIVFFRPLYPRRYRIRLKGNADRTTQCGTTVPSSCQITYESINALPTTVFSTTVTAGDYDLTFDLDFTPTGAENYLLGEWFQFFNDGGVRFVSYYSVEYIDDCDFDTIDQINTFVQYDLRETLPDISVADLISDLSLAWNLLIYTDDNNGIVHIEPLTPASGVSLSEPGLVLDYALDLSKPPYYKTQAQFLPARRDYKWADDTSDAGLQAYIAERGAEYGAYVWFNPEPLNTTQDVRQLTTVAPTITANTPMPTYGQDVWTAILSDGSSPETLSWSPRLVRLRNIPQADGVANLSIGQDFSLARCEDYYIAACSTNTNNLYTTAVFTDEPAASAPEDGLTFDTLQAGDVYGESTGLFDQYLALNLGIESIGREYYYQIRANALQFPDLLDFGRAFIIRGHIFRLIELYDFNAQTEIITLKLQFVR